MAEKEKEKIAKDTIYKKMQWSDEEKNRKFFIIERMNNSIVFGVKKWSTEEGKFDFKFAVAAYFNFDVVPAIIHFFKAMHKNLIIIQKEKETLDADRVHYTAEVEVKSGKGTSYMLQTTIKLDKNKDIVAGITIYNNDEKEYIIYKDNPFGKIDIRYSKEVAVGEDYQTDDALVTVAIEDLIEKLKTYNYDPVKASNFLTKMLDDGKDKRGSSGDDGEYPF